MKSRRKPLLKRSYEFNIGLDADKYPVAEGWTAELEDPDNGQVSVTPGDGVVALNCHVVIKDISRPAGIILKDPEGNTYNIPLVITQEGSGISVSY